jgi:hypothetical protein
MCYVLCIDKFQVVHWGSFLLSLLLFPNKCVRFCSLDHEFLKLWWNKDQRNAFFKRICESRVWTPCVCCQSKDPSVNLSTDNVQTVHLFRIHGVAYVQFYQDYIGLPEDGAPDAPKHVGARYYSKYMVILKNAFRWSFFHHKCVGLLFLAERAMMHILEQSLLLARLWKKKALMTCC